MSTTDLARQALYSIDQKNSTRSEGKERVFCWATSFTASTHDLGELSLQDIKTNLSVVRFREELKTKAGLTGVRQIIGQAMKADSLISINRLSSILANHTNPKIQEYWFKETKHLYDLHRILFCRAGKLSPNTRAWQAAFSKLIEDENNAVESRRRPPRHPLVYAMREVRRRLGSPPPAAAAMLQVEAIWLSVQIVGLILCIPNILN